MRLVLVSGSLRLGGAERVISRMADYWAGRGWSVRLVSLDDGRHDHFFPSDQVDRVKLDIVKAAGSWFDTATRVPLRLKAIRDAITGFRPDAVISFIETINLHVLLATAGSGVPVAVAERTDPRAYPIGRARDLARRTLYRRASAVVVQTERVASWARAFVPPSRVHVVPNAAPAPSPLPPRSGLQHPAIVGLGRLSSHKGFDLLLRAFAQVRADFPEWSLHVFGEGPERPALERLRAELGLPSDRVLLPGAVANPSAVLAPADVFVLSSRLEGFPNALLEAMTQGVACAAFDCESGPREILRSGVDGILVRPEDPRALAEALRSLMSSPELRRRMGEAARERSKAFDEASVMQQWEDVIARAREVASGV